MADGSALWVWQQIYEPSLTADGWTVHYRDPYDNSKWNQQSFAEHEKAYDFYWKQTKTLRDYYNTFLRELGVRSK